jgi:SAM-dependent methyltransferase
MTALEKFNKEFSKNLTFYNYGWSEGKNISISWIVDNIVGEDVLDVGGTTQLLKMLKANRGIVASIYDAFPLKDLLPGEYKDIYIGDFFNLLDVVGDKQFDSIIFRHSLEHTLNPLFVLWQANRLLKLGGQLIVIVPPHHNYWVWFYTHFNCLPEENWEMLFWRAGFKIVKKEHGHWDNEQSSPFFRETRYILCSETKDLRFGERSV